MINAKWSKTKPKFNKECILIIAIWIEDHWEYTLYTIEMVENPEGWYFGLICDDGEEWGDIDDLQADKYLVLPPLRHHRPRTKL